jgi:hypothetical protein
LAAGAALDEKARTDAAVTGDTDKKVTAKGKEGVGKGGDVERWHFVLGLETAPVIAWLLLLAATCINGEVIRNGIVGGGGVRPYDIMTLFLSFVSPPFTSIQNLRIRPNGYIIALEADIYRHTLPSRWTAPTSSATSRSTSPPVPPHPGGNSTSPFSPSFPSQV